MDLRYFSLRLGMSNYVTYSDQELVELVKNGDRAAFASLYDRYWKLIFAVAVAKLDSYVDAEEIVQEIFTDLWARRESIQINRSVKYYLAAAVKYQAMTVLAKRNRRSILKQDLLKSPDASSAAPSTFIEFAQLQLELENIVGMLPERCQLIYRLSREEGFSNKEIAQQLNLSEKTVETQMTRALSRIRTGLGDAALSLLIISIL